MVYIANGVGILAVVLFVLSYQLKKRRHIVLCNVISRGLYVVQYLLLFAFEGAVLDVLGMVASILAQKKESPFIKKHLTAVVLAAYSLMIAAGVLLYKNVFSLLPLLGVLLHTGAFWLDNEKHIRRVSLLGSPCWLVYNLVSRAYGSALGDALTIVSIGTAIIRYDVRGRTK